MVKNLLAQLYQKVVYRSMPGYQPGAPSENEQLLIKELRKTFEELPYVPTEGLSPAAFAWANYMNMLKTEVLNNDPRMFLKWEVLKNTMVAGNAAYTRKEYSHLKSLKDYESRWHPAIQEVPVGSPIRYKSLGKSSGNLIHHAYHVAMFEEKTKLSVTDIDFVFEFGGGYGSMCRLFYNLGFRKKFVIFDLAPFSALQKYFIKSLGIKVLDVDTFLNDDSGVLIISDVEELKKVIEKSDVSNLKSLFLATWSISETPIETRNLILPLVSDFTSFLIAYQYKFRDVNNLAFFEKFKDQHKNIDWNNWEIPQLQGHGYLIGNSKKQIIR